MPTIIEVVDEEQPDIPVIQAMIKVLLAIIELLKGEVVGEVVGKAALGTHGVTVTHAIVSFEADA